MTRKKILIVDYDQNNLKALEDLLATRKLEVITAYDGLEAYEVFKQEHPDLIVLEAMLPKLHGFDLTQKIYKETRGSIPIIIVTGLYKGPQYRNEALRSFGAADYFEKPYDKSRLLASVLNLLRDEIDIDEQLPDPEAVLDMVEQLSPAKEPDSEKKILP